MLETAAVMTFVATADAERSRRFYADTLGLRFVADDGFALVFDLNGTPLRIVRVEQVMAAPYTSLGWQVNDIAASVRQLTSRGVVFQRHAGLQQDELGIWTSPSGARVAWFTDPDGHTLSLTQM